MKFFIVAILFAFVETGVIGATNCINVNYKSYEKEILLDDVDSPYQLAIDRDTHTMFFSYTARTDEMFKSAYFSMKKNKTYRYAIVRGIRGGFANAVAFNNVYMGGENGIYMFDYDTMTATKLNINKNVNVWQMFYKDGLYFTTYPDEKAYFYKNSEENLYKDSEVVEVPALQDIKVMLLAVTNDKDLLYFNSSGIFLYGRKNDEHLFLKDTVANGVASDIHGNLYISSPNGIYYYNNELKKIVYLAKIDNVYGIAIENDDNIIYASENSIIRLKPAVDLCGEKDAIGEAVTEIYVTI